MKFTGDKNTNYKLRMDFFPEMKFLKNFVKNH